MSNRTRTKQILALDWDTRELRVVHAYVGKRGVKVDRLLSVPVPRSVDPANPEQMGRHIRRALEQEEIGARHAIVDIPRDQAILNTLRLPVASPDDLPGMVEIQIAKELPFALAEAVVDFAAPEFEPGAAKADVLVAAVRREVLDQYESTFAVAGLKLERVGLRPYAHKVAVGELLKHALPARVMFIDVRPSLTEIDVLRNGSLSFSRAASVLIPEGRDETPRLSIARGAEEVGAAESGPKADDEPVALSTEAVIRSLVVEVTRSIEAYRAGDPGGSIDHVVIGGDLGVEELLAEALQRRIGITTELYNPASTFGWEPDEGAAASAFAATLGLVLTQHDEPGKHFDFLHPKKTESAAQRQLKKAPAVAAVAVLFIAAGAVGLSKYTQPKRARLADIEKRIAELEADEKDSEQFTKLVEQIREFDTAQYVWIDVLREVISALPSHEELFIEHVDMKQSDRKGEGGRLELKTRGKHPETAMNAIRSLEEFRREGRDAPGFKASIKGAQTEKTGERYPYAQELWVQIIPRADTSRASTEASSAP